MMRSGVLVFAATQPSFAFGGRNKIFRIAGRDTLLLGKAFSAQSYQHHVRTIFKNSASRANRIFHALERRDRTRAQGCAFHDDGVALHAAVKIQVRAITGVEDRVVLKHDDGGLDGVKRRTAARKYGPPGSESVMTARSARFDSVVRNIPSPAVND
jgi:hypothetical protein